MQLVIPRLEHESAFRAFYDDFAAHDAVNAPYYQPGIVDFGEYIASITAQMRGEHLADGQVPCHHFWLLEQRQLVGAIRVRHHIDTPYLNWEGGHIGYDVAPSQRQQGYGKQLLKLALPEAKRLGLSRVLLVAEESNRASRAVIEANGGVLEATIVGLDEPTPLVRYWIEL
ncbi:GNAT family N-acetyltransferase [Shewanella sp.]|uniref:GNAT family N-acetyltransferase n=1 Tax=Shewanella sp. TaxID=50422 RepID=UPI003A976039